MPQGKSFEMITLLFCKLLRFVIIHCLVVYTLTACPTQTQLHTCEEVAAFRMSLRRQGSNMFSPQISIDTRQDLERQLRELGAARRFAAQ